MIELVIGTSNTGEKQYLQDKLTKLTEAGIKCVSNLFCDKSNIKIDQHKIDLLYEDDFNGMIFNGCDIKGTENGISIYNDDTDQVYPEYFLRIMTLLCMDADTVILDMADFSLSGTEEIDLMNVLLQLKESSTNYIIATHYELMFTAADKYILMNGSEVIKTATNDSEVWDHIASFGITTDSFKEYI